MDKIKTKPVLMLSVFLISILMLLFVFGCSGKEVVNTEDTSSTPAPVDSSSPEEELICPQGIGSEPAPGTCPLFRDENNDGFCDFKK